ncbi:MAG TPA: hypothetical protein VFU20_08360 [Sphingomicrobium sp.]|nr:hypothetical protein [Sphingomicrobium sp.]
MTYHSLPALAALGLALAHPAAAETVLPTFDAGNFTGNPVVTSSYFPVVEGQERTYLGSPADEQFVLTGVGSGPVILGIKTVTLRDRSFEGGLIVEDTFDYYAQDKAGNVWYFGEDVTNYNYDRDGNLIGTDSASSWRAGVNGALPGYIMPVDQTVGFNYYQEHAPEDDALDEGTTFAVLSSFTAGGVTYSNVLQVLETSDIDPKARGFKYYAPGVGLIYEAEGLRPNNKNPRQIFELTEIGTASSASRPAFEFRRVPKN